MINLKNFSLFSINEKSLSDITPQDINFKSFINIQDEKGFLNPYVSQYMAEENDVFYDTEMEDEDETNDIIKSNDFQDWIYFELEHRFTELTYKFNELINNNKITLYRAMTVKKDYIKNLISNKIKHIGIYWSYDEDGAETHWGFNLKITDTIIYEIKINQQYINWVDTIRLNLEHEYFNEEKEIRLFRNTPVEITNILWNDKNVNVDVINKIQQYNIVT